jgi:hypothetical protein
VTFSLSIYFDAMLGGSFLTTARHGTARLQVADGGESLRIWRAAATILNKESRTADKMWSSSLGGWAWGQEEDEMGRACNTNGG